MPALGHSPASELHGTLIERRLELQEEQCLLYIEDSSHDLSKLAAPPSKGTLGRATWSRARP